MKRAFRESCHLNELGDEIIPAETLRATGPANTGRVKWSRTGWKGEVINGWD